MKNSTDIGPKSFLLTALGSKGDIIPLLWAGKKLSAHDHKISFLANGFFKEQIESYGFKFIPLGTKQEFTAYFQDSRLWKPIKAIECTILMMRKTAQRYKEALIPRIQDFDAIINNPLALGAAVIAEKFNKACVTLHPHPFSFLFSAYDMPVITENLALFKKAPKGPLSIGLKIASEIVFNSHLEELNKFREDLGLAGVSDLYQDAWLGDRIHAGLFPEWFAHKQPDWPKHFETFDFPINENSFKESLDPQIEKFLSEGPPPILWTFGTLNLQAEELVKKAVLVSKILKNRAIVISPLEPRIDGISNSTKIMHLKHVSAFGALLKRCHAIVHHGGVGTLSHSLKAGIPQLAMPIAHDHFDNSDRLQKLGVAYVLKVKKRTPQDYAEALEKLLIDGNVKQNVEKYKLLMNSNSKCKNFVKWIEEQVYSPTVKI